MKKVFILGNPRSGTSLLRIMLNCHPYIASPPECGFLQWWYEKYRNWSENDLYNGRIDEFLDDLFTSKKFETWNLEKHKLKIFLLNKKPSNYSDLTLAIYVYWASTNGTDPKVIIDKNNYYIHHLSEIKNVWPEALFIILVRDGRDVACSYKRIQELDTDSPYKPDLPTEIKDIAIEWKGNHEKIFEFLKDVDQIKYTFIKYEDLVSKPTVTLDEISNFLNLEFSRNMLLYYVKNQEQGMEPDSTLDWKKKTLRKPDSSNIGKYQKILSDEEIKVFNDITGNILNRFDYST